MWAATKTEHFARTVEIMHERNIANLKNMLEADVVDLYRISEPEYGTPPHMPPSYFERFVLPYVTEMVELIHRKNAKVRVHCHGKIRGVLDMILETGADSIDPCEAPPDGDITLAEVKKHLAGRMSIFGHIQVKLLERARAEEVETAVIECMRAAKEGGGFVIMPTAAPFGKTLASKTEENYLRFIDTALEHGAY
jgi:uroporphyrinogen-III decarboxylase